jgi:HEAT repeat protein
LSHHLVRQPGSLVALWTLLGTLALSAQPGTTAASAPVAQRSFEDYTRDLKSTDPDVRAGALRALAASGYPEALVPLSGLLTDPLDGIQLEAIRAVLGFYVTELPPSRKRVALFIEKRESTGPAQRLFDTGPFVLLPRRTPPEVVSGLSAAMRDDSPSVRLEAVYALGVVGQPPLDPAVAEVLQGGLRDPLVEIRAAAARALGGLRVREAGDALIEAMNDEKPEVRAAAMLALGDIRETRAVQPLNQQYSHYGKGPMAENAFDALARIGHPSSVPLFQSELASRSAVIRRRAAEGLARSGNPALAAGVETSLADERDEPVLVARAFALQVAGRPALDQIVAAVGDADTEAQAMSYLVELGRPIAAQLGRHLRDPEPRVRARVAMTLGLIGGEEAIAALEPATRDPDTEVARAAERAIARARILDGR